MLFILFKPHVLDKQQENASAAFNSAALIHTIFSHADKMDKGTGSSR